MQKEVWTNIGLDESNNGFDKKHPHLPAIYVATSSDLEKHLKYQDKLLPKYRKNHKSLHRRTNGVDYNFLLLTRPESELIPPDKRIGIILASLLHEKILINPLNLYIDGEWSKETKDFTKGILSETKGLEKDLISFSCGKDWDRRYQIINFADELAHWLINKTLKTLRNKPQRKELLVNSLKKYI